MTFLSERSKNLIKLYKWNNVFFKYFKKSILFILLPLTILSLCIFYYVIRTDEESIITNRNRSFYQTASVLENVFNDIENNHILLSNSDEVSTFCSFESAESVFADPHATYPLRKLIRNIEISSQYIRNVHIYSVESDFVFSGKVSSSPDSFHLREWYDRYTSTDTYNFVYYESSGDLSNGKSGTVAVIRGLMNNASLIGIAIYEIDESIFLDILKKGSINNEQYILHDISVNVFFATDAGLIGTNIEQSISGSVTPPRTDMIREGNIISFTAPVSYYHFIMRFDVSMQRNVTGIVFLIIALLIFVLIISFVLSFYLSLQFYKAIIRITATLRNDDENAEGEIYESRYNELYYINSHIVSRFNKKSHIEKELSDQITELKKAQFIALQTQLNPHFIYNTLNLINVMVLNLAKKDCDASRAIVILSQLLREALDTKKIMVTLKDEMEYANKYISLQKLKYNYNISVAWNIDERLLEHKVIKFMLQPIIENAFEHGFSHIKTDEYRMIISATYENNGNDIAISVTNNGSGLEPDALRQLQDNLNSDMIFEQKRIGLMNVNHRIRIIYGDNYGCTVESDKSGTTVSILLPNDDMDLPFSN